MFQSNTSYLKRIFLYFSVEAYLDMACSLVLYGGSNNKEYALHILQRTRGNVKVCEKFWLTKFVERVIFDRFIFSTNCFATSPIPSVNRNS